MRRSLTLALVSITLFWTSALALPNEISYEIQVRLDPQEHKLIGSERILFTSKADKPLTELYLHLWPNRFAPGSVTAREMGQRAFDALFPYGPDYGYVFIRKLQINSKDTKYTIDDTILKIELESSIAPDQTIEIAIDFVVKIPRALGRLGHDSGNYYISWWYPKMSVYDQKGWHPDVAHAEMTAAEPYEDFAKYAVELTVPKGMVVGATGNLSSERENGDGTKTLAYTAENVHDFAWVADARYQREIVQWEDVQIISLYWPEDAAAGKRAAHYAKDAIEYFSKRFGRYPYRSFIVAEVGMYGGAMEYPQLIQQSYMLYRLPEFLNLLDSVTAHEIAHQWFYGLFMNNQLEETWLDEGFATYAQISYIEEKYGREGNNFNQDWLKRAGLGALGGLLRGSEREDAYNAYLRVAREGREAPLSTPLHKVPKGKTALPYQKGAAMLFALESLVSREKFDQILQEYYRRYRYRQVTTEDFVRTTEEISQRDLKEFFEQWLNTTKTLDYVLEDVHRRQIESRHITRVALRQAGTMNMPVDVEATLEDQSKIRQRWEGRDERGTLTFVTEQPVRSVVIDPDKMLPDLDRSDNYMRSWTEKLNLSLLVDHGMLHGRPDDGLILGLRMMHVEVGWAFGLQRFVFKQEMKRSFCFADRCTSEWGFAQKDDGHVFANDGFLHLRWYRANTHAQLSLSALHHRRYTVASDPGVVFAVGVGYERSSSLVGLRVIYKLGLNALGGEYAFQKFSWNQEIRNDLAWQTLWVQRTVLGWREGREPEERDFNLRDFPGFRAFAVSSDWVFAQVNELRLPIPALNKIDIGPIPLSIGAIAFVNMAILKLDKNAVRAEAGVGLIVGLYRSPILYIEYPLWVNTLEGALQRVTVRFERAVQVRF